MSLVSRFMKTIPSVANALRDGPPEGVSWRIRDTMTVAFLKAWLDQAARGEMNILEVQQQIQAAPKPPWPVGYRWEKISVPVEIPGLDLQRLEKVGPGAGKLVYPRKVDAFWVRKGVPLPSLISTTPIEAGPDESIVLYFHGGAHVVGSTESSHKWAVTKMSKAVNGVTFSVDYSLSPSYPFPFAMHDAVASYLYLLQTYKPEHIFLAGDSAGGNLAFGLLMWLKEHGKPMPGGVVGLSPWVDLTHSCPSFTLNAAFDYLPESVTDPVLLPNGKKHFYCENHEIKTSQVSPLWADDLKGLPPILIQVGQAERLRDEGKSLAVRLLEQNSVVVFEEYVSQFHVFQMLPGKMSNKSFSRIGEFVKHVREGTVRSEFGIVKEGGTLTHQPLSEIKEQLKQAFKQEEDLVETTHKSPEQLQKEMEASHTWPRKSPTKQKPSTNSSNSLPRKLRDENVLELMKKLSI